jgi:hypothetical protein
VGAKLEIGAAGDKEVIRLPRLLVLPPEQLERETRRAAEQEAAEQATARTRMRVYGQCILLTFLGVPVYLYSWHLTDPRSSELAATLAFLVSYAAPFFRWLAYQINESGSFAK